MRIETVNNSICSAVSFARICCPGVSAAIALAVAKIHPITRGCSLTLPSNLADVDGKKGSCESSVAAAIDAGIARISQRWSFIIETAKSRNLTWISGRSRIGRGLESWTKQKSVNLFVPIVTRKFTIPHQRTDAQSCATIRHFFDKISSWTSSREQT